MGSATAGLQGHFTVWIGIRGHRELVEDVLEVDWGVGIGAIAQ